MLKHFKVDPTRTKLVVPVEFYQMNMIRAVEAARKEMPDLFVDGSDQLPSWTKWGKDPIKAKGFWTRMLQAVFLGQGNLPELDVEYQTQTVSSFQVSMMFLPGSLTIKGDKLKNVVTMTQQVLKGWEVLEISGGGMWNGRRITNRNAERVTLEAIEKCKQTDTPLLILSRGMAQRSYSIGEITSLFLCYDEGDAGATTQKISRALTPSKEGKIGRIFSLSFDPNRDDKFDTMMIASAQNYAKRKDVEVEEALRRVLGTIDIFATSEDGRVDIDHDTYLQQILDRNSLSRMVGKQADMEELSMDEIAMLASGNSDFDSLDKTDSADRGKTGDKAKGKAKTAPMSKEELKLLDKARKTLATIVEHLPYLAFATNTKTVRESLEVCRNSKDYNAYVTHEFGVPPKTILELFDRGVLNYDLASLQKAGKQLNLANNS
jgi:hypothetical protein